MLKKLSFAALLICMPATIYAQQAPSPLLKLVSDSAQRLAIAHQVAFAKWDSRTPVEDSAREAQVIQSAVSAGQAMKLDETLVADFFRAQIEANKIVQYSLLADWRRAGRAPDHPSVNLAATIRPELDRLQSSLIEDLSQSANVRSQPNCQTLVAAAVGEYLSVQKKSSAELNAIALDRALGHFCMR